MSPIVKFGGGFILICAALPLFFSAKGVQMPDDEAAFCQNVERLKDAYSSANGNEIRIKDVMADRDRSTATGRVASWTAKVDQIDVSTIADGAFLSVEIPCATLRTWNNALSDTTAKTIIPTSSPLYQTLRGLSSGQAVTVSGEIIKGSNGAVVEMSMSNSGAIRSPEFLFRFDDVTAKK